MVQINCSSLFYQHGLTSIPAWISNLMHSKVWDEITYPFLNFNGCPVEVWEWISNFIQIFIMDVNYLSMLGLKLNRVSKRVQVNRRQATDPSHRCGHPQAANQQEVMTRLLRAAICFEHKTLYLLIRAPYTRIMVFWHINIIPPMISQSQISCNTPTFCIAAIFVKCCYTTGSWLL